VTTEIRRTTHSISGGIIIKNKTNVDVSEMRRTFLLLSISVDLPRGITDFVCLQTSLQIKEAELNRN